MDEKSYPKPVIRRYLESRLFFKDPLLKKYFNTGQVKRFRNRVHRQYPKESFEKLVYVLITDSIRDIILDTVGELTVFMKTMGDLIISGGEAFNMYMEYKDRIITSDIDAKFVPRIAHDTRYFGKLQAIKLILWDKLGQISKRLNTRIKNRILSRKTTLFRFLGVGFGKRGPFVTRRYTLIKKKKWSDDNKPSTGDVFIDVELFALDLQMRYFSIASGKIEPFTLGGILDIPFMRPDEFGYGVVKSTLRKGITYRNMKTGHVKINNNVTVASKEFLVEDIYLMHKLKLRPEKREKDRQRLVKLAKILKVRMSTDDTIDTLFKKMYPKITRVKRRHIKPRRPTLNGAMRVDPYAYEKYTTTPSKEKVSKQFVHGLNPTVPMNVPGFEKSHGDQRFNMDTLTWKRNTSEEYIKNEFSLRPVKAKPLPDTLNVQETLYGFRPRRDGWIPKPLLKRAAAIPFVGLKI
jgi:hypothetical protein